jgi:TRAP-type C4-dicarboxylate transport system permease small subunit
MMLVVEKFSPQRRRYAELQALLVAMVAGGVLAWWANFGVYESWRFDEMSIGLLIVPIWIPQLAFALGADVLLLAIIDELVTVLRGRRPSYQVAVDERHARGDFTEDI